MSELYVQSQTWVVLQRAPPTDLGDIPTDLGEVVHADVGRSHRLHLRRVRPRPAVQRR